MGLVKETPKGEEQFSFLLLMELAKQFNDRNQQNVTAAELYDLLRLAVSMNIVDKKPIAKPQSATDQFIDAVARAKHVYETPVPEDQKPASKELVQASLAPAATPFEGLANVTPYVEDEVDIEEHYDLHVYIQKEDFMDAARNEGNANNRSRYMNRIVGLAKPKILQIPNPSVLTKLNKLEATTPNFSKVTADVKAAVAAQLALEMPIKLLPIILVGGPGIGKTRYMRELATCLNLSCLFLPLSGSADALKIKGVGQGWGSARPAEFMFKLSESECANPLVCFDEIDKCSRGKSDTASDTPSALLTLLEPTTARLWEDEYIAKTMDLSPLNCVFTANSLDDVPSHFLSRCQVYEIEEPTYEERLVIIKNMVKEIAASEYKQTKIKVTKEAVELLAEHVELRAIWREIYYGLAKVLAEQSTLLEASYLKPPASKQVRKNSIGFTANIS